MYDSRMRKWVGFLIALMTFGVALSVAFWRESVTCMGVRILSEEALSAYTEFVYIDLSDSFYFNGEPVAVDVSTSTIYISQDIQKETKVQNLVGKLSLTDNNYQLSFVQDSYFNDLFSAAKQNHAFQLRITGDSGQYMQYDVVLTSLPVLRIDGRPTYEDEKGRSVMTGEVCLWTPADADTGGYSVKSSYSEWHIRGNSSTGMPKVPWKISLKDKNGENQNVAFLGLGEDDDWILNPMCLDDTKLKENLFMHLWNALAAEVSWNEKMSSGEYVEVIMNKEYMGAFLMQRRIDGKYLNLGDGDILLKGNQVWKAAQPQDAYEIVAAALRKEDVYALVTGVYDGSDCSIIQLNNFIDVSLFLQFASAQDNIGFKNMFYVLKRDGESYALSMIPWDTDVSWGVTWSDAIVYDFEKSGEILIERMEFSSMLGIHPDLNERLAARWKTLREDILALENILSVLESLNAQLEHSGALDRDFLRWGWSHGGEDNAANLARFIEERLQYLDEYYSGLM